MTFRFLKFVPQGIALLFSVVLLTPATGWWARAYSVDWPAPKPATLIILGGSVVEPNIAGYSSYLRALYALRLWRQGHVQAIFISGGLTTASTIRQLLVGWGIPASSMRLEENSLSTRENALFTAAILASEPGDKMLLTSDFHMLRASHAFARAGLPCQPFPIPDGIKRANFFSLRFSVMADLVEESAKLVYYWSRGWL